MFEASEMRDVVRGSMGRLTLMLAVISAAAAVTVAMGTIGLYGVMAYAVALRTREFGLRMALGAAPDRIARWILARGLMLTAFGISAGGIVFAIVVPYLRASIHGIAPCDPLPVVGAVALLLCTSALACWIPARRASAVDPAQALRAG